MAGTYADVPGQRFALGDDGTVAYRWTSADYVQSQVSSSLLANISELDPNPTTYPVVPFFSNLTGFLCLFFPEPRSIRGLYWHLASGSTSQFDTVMVEWSADTTDGISGTWTAFAATGQRYGVSGTNPYPNYRTSIAAANADNVKAVRFRAREGNGSTRNMEIRVLHIYGTRSTTVDRLAFWHPTLDQALTGSYFDFGDQARGIVSGGKQFRIKNLSATKTATNVKVQGRGANGSELGSPGLQLSTEDGTTWNLETPLFNLAPGALSSIYQARLSLTDVNLVTPQARSGRLSTVIGTYA